MGEDRNNQNPIPDQTPHTELSTEDALRRSPSTIGEQDSVGGTTPHPATDDDIDDMHQRTFGNTPDKGEEIPNLADEINKDEKAIKES